VVAAASSTAREFLESSSSHDGVDAGESPDRPGCPEHQRSSAAEHDEVVVANVIDL
jgi:hypothetical protein